MSNYFKLFVRKLKLIIDDKKIIPDHQFDFHTKHGTTRTQTSKPN